MRMNESACNLFSCFLLRRDLEGLKNGCNISQIGTLNKHTRPVECLAYDPDTTGTDSATLFSADSMGVIMVWNLQKLLEPRPECRATLKTQLAGHSTGVNDMWFGLDQLWTGTSLLKADSAYVLTTL